MNFASKGKKLLAAGTMSAALLTASAHAQEPIKIGVLGPNSGPFTTIGEEIRFGLELFFEQNGNEVAGRQIELIYEDTGARPDVGLTKTEKLVESDDVDFLAGIVSSSVAYAVRDYVVESGVPLLITVASADGLTQQLAAPNIFRTGTSGSQNSHPFGTWLYEEAGYRKLILMASNYAMGYEQTGGFARTFVEAGGEVVRTIYPPLGPPDFSPFLTAFDPAEADAVGAVFAGSDAIKFVTQYTEYGLNDEIPLVGTGLLVDDLILEAQGDAALGIVAATHYTSVIDTPENADFVAAYREKYGRTPTLYAESSYVAGQLLAHAIEELEGDISDTDAVLAEIAAAELTAPRGPFKFDGSNSPVHTVYITRVERVDGRLASVPIAEFEEVSQFYTWGREDYLAMPPYSEIPDTWAN